MSIFLPDDRYRLLIHVCGAIVVCGTFAVGVYFFIMEAPVIWQESKKLFFIDSALRLSFGLLFSAVAFLPYIAGSIAAKKTGASAVMFVVCAVVFILDVYARIDSVFYSESSTGSLIIIFLPFYLAIPVFITWGVAAVLGCGKQRIISRE